MTAALTVPVFRLAHGKDLALPTYASKGSAGLDLRAALSDDITVEPGQRALIPTGLRIALPEDHEAQVRPRSGLALKHGVTVLNSPGTIDSDYRGEIGVILVNHGAQTFRVSHGMRIAQLVVAPVTRTTLSEVDALPESARGDDGFGSTGLDDASGRTD